jgi:hypothetical protein
MGIKYITSESMAQYQKEERALIATRLKTSTIEIEDLLTCMENDKISTRENVDSLKRDLAKHYKNEKFLNCANMGQILRQSLEQVLKR